MQELYFGQKAAEKIDRDRDRNLRVLAAFYDTNIRDKATNVAIATGYIKIDIGAVLMLKQLLEPKYKVNKGVSNE